MAPVNELLVVLLRPAQASLGMEDVVMTDKTLWIFTLTGIRWLLDLFLPVR